MHSDVFDDVASAALRGESTDRTLRKKRLLQALQTQSESTLSRVKQQSQPRPSVTSLESVYLDRRRFGLQWDDSSRCKPDVAATGVSVSQSMGLGEGGESVEVRVDVASDRDTQAKGILRDMARGGQEQSGDATPAATAFPLVDLTTPTSLFSDVDSIASSEQWIRTQPVSRLRRQVKFERPIALTAHPLSNVHSNSSPLRAEKRINPYFPVINDQPMLGSPALSSEQMLPRHRSAIGLRWLARRRSVKPSSEEEVAEPVNQAPQSRPSLARFRHISDPMRISSRSPKQQDKMDEQISLSMRERRLGDEPTLEAPAYQVPKPLTGPSRGRTPAIERNDPFELWSTASGSQATNVPSSSLPVVTEKISWTAVLEPPELPMNRQKVETRTRPTDKSRFMPSTLRRAVSRPSIKRFFSSPQLRVRKDKSTNEDDGKAEDVLQIRPHSALACPGLRPVAGGRTAPSNSYLTTEARRVTTPPIGKSSTGKPRGRFWDMLPPMSDSAEDRDISQAQRQPFPMPESTFAKPPGSPTQLHSRANACDRDWYRVRFDDIMDDNDIESPELPVWDVPDHLPTSPLCPLHPRYRRKIQGSCPYHARKKSILKRSAV